MKNDDWILQLQTEGLLLGKDEDFWKESTTPMLPMQLNPAAVTERLVWLHRQQLALMPLKLLILLHSLGSFRHIETFVSAWP